MRGATAHFPSPLFLLSAIAPKQRIKAKIMDRLYSNIFIGEILFEILRHGFLNIFPLQSQPPTLFSGT
jgi:hypothetical protein